MFGSVRTAASAAFLWSCFALPALAQPKPLLEILSQELERNFRILKEKAEPAPYFLAYSVTEQEGGGVAASLGALQSRSSTRHRVLDVIVRVGTPALDNYHRMPGETPQFTSGALIALDDDPDAIRRQLWLETDRTYRLAAQRLIKIRTNTQVKVEAQDKSEDFSKEDPPAGFSSAPPKLNFDADALVPRLRALSAGFSRFPMVLNSSVSVVAQRETKYFASTEGARLVHGRRFARILIQAQSKAVDGMDLATSETFESEDPARLPADKEIEAAVGRVGADLTNLLIAPVVDPFVGPAILSGRAAGVFFHEIFGHRVEGHRQKDETDGQTFAKSLNERVLPEFLSVLFDPTRKAIGSVDLNGWYSHDDEGTPARPVTVVDNGILKTFLMSRSPIEGIDRSNGHGRKQPGAEAVSRQSNLIVESAKKVPDDRLRQMLIEEVRRQNKPYGLYFEYVTGGFTQTGRRGIQAFKVIPVVVYRVYPDGRPDELVRGADIVGTPLASFAKILATGSEVKVFNGYCGAESGSVPVSAVSPAVLVSELEIQRKEKSQERPPLLTRPLPGGTP